MAYTDYDQSQIIAQIQAFFHIKSASHDDFLQGADPGPIDGQFGALISAAIEAWLEHKGLADEVTPDDPTYLQRVHHEMATDLSTDRHAHAEMEIMRAAFEREPPENLEERLTELREQQFQLQQQVEFGQERMDEIAAQVEAGEREDYGNASQIQ